MQFDIAIFFTLRDGKVIKIREIIDTFDLIEQVVEQDVAELIAGKPGDNK